MGSLFRSEEMRLCQLFLQTEATYACVSELGELGLVQFKDLNENVNAFQRTYVSEIRRCEEMERKLRYTEKEILKDKMKIPDNIDNPKTPAPKEMNDLEVEFEKMDNELRQVNTNNEALKQNYLELKELKEVLEGTQTYFAVYGQDIQQMINEETQGHEEAIIGSSSQQTAALGFYVGTILREKVPVFERVMRFVTHSTVFMRIGEIAKTFEDPVTGDELHKCMFLVFYQGEQLRNKVKKVCEGMKGTIYPVPDSNQERQEMLHGVKTRIVDLENVLAQSNEHRKRVLSKAQKEIRAWTIKVEKIKAIYHTMNMFKVHLNSLTAECWFPVKAIDDIRRALSIGEKISGSTIPSVIQPMVTEERPPTYYNCNKFVKGFQNIVDSYGISTYGEVNPAPYTVITFPFLFAVMFGDAGHGFIMFLFGLLMILKEKSIMSQKLTNEIASTFFGGRYIIMMMGLFSIYTGVIYNDAFSRSFNIFGTHWYPNLTYAELRGPNSIQLNPVFAHKNASAYLIGVDPIWQSAKNKITFFNSLKMKMAIILGVIHMLFGVSLSVFNHLHFREYIDIFAKFIPKLLFLGCWFGYLVAMIFYKWIMFDGTKSSCAPALIIHYINMFMFKYTSPINGNLCDPNLTFYKGQDTVQYVMFFLAILSIPVLLIVKPVYLICFKNKRAKKSDIYHPSDAPISNEVSPADNINQGFQEDGHDGFGNGHSKEGPTNGTAVAIVHDLEAPAQSHGGHGHGHEEVEGPTNGTAVAIVHDLEAPAQSHGGHGHGHEEVEGPTNGTAVAIVHDLEAPAQSHGGHGHGHEEVEGPTNGTAVAIVHDLEAPAQSHGGHGHGHEEVDTGEIIIHQAIETIEFCLGCISHTASYLRLWALSLAHAELSEVLWHMVLHNGLIMGGRYIGGVVTFVIFFFWANLTVAILLLMEGLSAFLHTLRLHWVEFQSKFYKGEGYAFEPFTFKHILSMQSLEEVTS